MTDEELLGMQSSQPMVPELAQQHLSAGHSVELEPPWRLASLRSICTVSIRSSSAADAMACGTHVGRHIDAFWNSHATGSSTAESKPPSRSLAHPHRLVKAFDDAARFISEVHSPGPGLESGSG